jgi:cytosine/adenosine deaminase-related metal-dependent hydrolase
MCSPPIANGAVRVSGTKIVEVGLQAELRALNGEETVRLDGRILLPGFINAHCHLDYSCMRDAIAPPKSFSAWVKKLNSIKRQLSDADILESIARGIEESRMLGTTSVCSMAAFPELMSRMPESPIRIWWFYEMIDIKHRFTSEDVVAGALSFFENQRDPLCSFGLNPHAPYTASLLLYRLAQACASSNDMLVTTHVAESAEESAMFKEARGELYDFLRELERPMHDCGHDTPFGWLWRNGAIGADSILAHMNELEACDFALLSTLPAESIPHIVHCPGSHAYFGHRPFEFGRLRELGANISIGTDSLASTNSLSLLEELRRLAQTNPAMDAHTLLETITTAPAKALKLHGKLGCIQEGALADMIALPGSGSVETACAEVLGHTARVPWMMVNGSLHRPAAL